MDWGGGALPGGVGGGLTSSSASLKLSNRVPLSQSQKTEGLQAEHPW